MLRVDHLSLGSKLVRDALQLRRVPRMAASSDLEEVKRTTWKPQHDLKTKDHGGVS